MGVTRRTFDRRQSRHSLSHLPHPHTHTHARSLATTSTGAAGLQGTAIANELSKDSNYELHGIVRSLDTPRVQALQKAVPSIKLHVGSIADKAALGPLVTGMDYMFLMTCAGPFWDVTTKDEALAKAKTVTREQLVKDEEKEYEQGTTMIDLAKKAGVKHIVFSSARSADKTSNGKIKLPHFDGKARVSEYLAKSGVAHTITHNAISMEALCRFFPLQKTNGALKITLPMGDAKLPLFATADYGQAVHNILNATSKWNGKTVHLVCCNEPLKTIAERLTKALGQTVTYEPETIEQFEKHAVLPNAGKAFQYMQEFPDKEACVDVTKQLIPRLTTTEAWAKAHVDVLTGKAACSDWECNTVKALMVLLAWRRS